MQVEAVITKSDAPAVAGALVSSYGRIVGHAPQSRSSWLLPLAQSALETDHWRAMWNFNAGNITSGHPDSEPWLRTPLSGLHLDHGGEAHKLRFRAYGSLEDGTDALMRWIADHAGGIAAIDAGDVPGFVGVLQRGGYVGRDPAVYGPYRTALAQLVKDLGGVEPAGGGGGGVRRWAPVGGGDAGDVAARPRSRGGPVLVLGLAAGGFALSRLGRRVRA